MPQLVLFHTGNIHFAIERDEISHIESPKDGFAIGLRRVQCQTVMHNGGAMDLIDLTATVNKDSQQSYPPGLKIIMLKSAPSLGLLAEKISGALDVDPQQMDVLPPVFAGKARAYFPRIVRLGDHLGLVIDAATLPELLPADPKVVEPCEVQG